MMKHLMITGLTLFSVTAYSQITTEPNPAPAAPQVIEEEEEEQPRNLISISTDGFGWAGSGTAFEFDKDKSTRDEQTVSEGKLALNYAYIFPTRFMLGGEVDYEGSRTKIELQSGDELESNTQSTSLALILGYNFNENIYNSWWILGKLGGAASKTEEEDSTATPRKTEIDITSGFATIEFGKRFQFSSKRMKALTFSPSISITSQTFGEDAEDAGIESAVTARINLLKFDVLF